MSEASKPHSELADIIEAGFDRFTPYDLCVPEAKAALESLVEQYEHLKETLRIVEGNFAEERRGLVEQYEDVRDKWVTLDAEHDRLKEQLEAYRSALEKIANEDADEWDWPAVAREALNPATGVSERGVDKTGSRAAGSHARSETSDPASAPDVDGLPCKGTGAEYLVEQDNSNPATGSGFSAESSQATRPGEPGADPVSASERGRLEALGHRTWGGSVGPAQSPASRPS